jgi:hypothetical protein
VRPGPRRVNQCFARRTGPGRYFIDVGEYGLALEELAGALDGHAGLAPA